MIEEAPTNTKHSQAPTTASTRLQNTHFMLYETLAQKPLPSLRRPPRSPQFNSATLLLPPLKDA